MKFFKTKAITALSLTLLFSTQIKPMGVDFGIDAGDEIKPTLTEQAKQALQSARHKAVDIASSAVQTAQPYVSKAVQAAQPYVNKAVEAAKPYAVNAVGMAVQTGNKVMANPAMSAGIAAGVTGAGILAYKKPHVAGGIAAAGIAAGTATLIAHDNPELVEAGKKASVTAGQAIVNTGKAVADFAMANSSVVYNAATQNIVANYISQNSEIVVPAILAGTAATYYGYTPVKNAVKAVGRQVARAAGVVAPYAGKAAQAVSNNAGKIAVAGTVAGVAGLIAYDNQEAIVAGKDVAAVMAQDAVKAVANVDYAHYGQKAINAVKPAGAFVAKQASKLKVNGARMINAARNLDYKKMAVNAGKYLDAHKTSVVATATVPAIASVGYVAEKIYDNKQAKATPVGLEDVRNLFVEPKVLGAILPEHGLIKMTEIGNELQNASLIKPIEIKSVRQVAFAEPMVTNVRLIEKRSNQELIVQPKTELPGAEVSKELNPAITLLPGEYNAPIAADKVYNSINHRPVGMKQLVSRAAEEFKVAAPVLIFNVENEASVLVRKKPVSISREELIEKAIKTIAMHQLTSIEISELEYNINALADNKVHFNDLYNLNNRIDELRRTRLLRDLAAANRKPVAVQKAQ